MGGSYPVNVRLSDCSTANSHWDFNFRIAAPGDLDDCLCNGVTPTHLRITFFDNPKRSRLWITNGFGGLPDMPGSDNPQSRTENDPRLYVQKVLQLGDSALFPAQEDMVRRVSGPPHTGFDTNPVTDTEVGLIAAPGGSDDSLHALINPSGGDLPCSVPPLAPMAYYRVECGVSDAGPWTQLGALGEINTCVPMIQASVSRICSDGVFRLGVSVRNSCDIPPSNFAVTNIQRNDDTNFPNLGGSVWSGSRQLSAGVTDIDVDDDDGSGGQYWISFTTDGGANTSRIRVPIGSTICATNNQASCPGGNRTIAVTWTGGTTKIQYRVADGGGNFPINWINQNDTSSPGTISLSGSSKCRAVQVRLCDGGGNGQTCDSPSSIVTVPQLA